MITDAPLVLHVSSGHIANIFKTYGAPSPQREGNRWWKGSEKMTLPLSSVALGLTKFSFLKKDKEEEGGSHTMKCQHVTLEIKAYFKSLLGLKQFGMQIRLVLADSGHAHRASQIQQPCVAHDSCCRCHPQLINFEKLLDFN